MLNCDSAFAKGSTHRICEDYATTRTCTLDNDNVAIISVVSDGCSSSKNTDIGSRMLCTAFINSVIDDVSVIDPTRVYLDPLTIETSVAYHIIKINNVLKLPLTTFDATIVGVVHFMNEFHIFMFGDGAFSVQIGSAKQISVVEFNANAPYYLTYKLDSGRDNGYNLLNQRVVNTTNFYNNGNFGIAENSINTTYYAKKFADTDEDVIVTVMSDGIGSFNPDNPLPANDIALQMTEFKNYNGEFVKRRFNKFIKSADAHYDDVSIASICSIKQGKDHE